MIGARTGGLDTQIRNRMMQSPMQLQQNYKQKGDILDLIALQMIKSEQDKKKKDLMLKMQRNPNTIKQQIEKAVMQQTKDDLVKQTSGILALKNARASIIQPFHYTLIFWAIIFGFFFYEDIPDLFTILGAIIITTS